MLEKLRPSEHFSLEFEATGDKEIDYVIKTLCVCFKWRHSIRDWVPEGKNNGDPCKYKEIKSLDVEGKTPQEWLQNSFNKAAKNRVTKEEIETAARTVEEVLLENEELKKQNNKLALKIKTLEKNDRPWYHENKERKSKGKKTTESGCITASEIINFQDEYLKYKSGGRLRHHRRSDGSEWTRFDSDSYGSGPLKDSS